MFRKMIFTTLVVALLFIGGVPNVFFGLRTCPIAPPPEAVAYACRPINTDLFIRSDGLPRSLVGSLIYFPLVSTGYTLEVWSSGPGPEGGYVWNGGTSGVLWEEFEITYQSGEFTVSLVGDLGDYEAFCTGTDDIYLIYEH